MLGQVPAAELDELAVDVHHDGPLDGRVGKNFPEGRAFAAADHKCCAGRIGGREHPGMDEGVVIDELVALARLHAAVEDEELAEADRLEDVGLLERGPGGGDGADHRMEVPVTRCRGLDEPRYGTGGTPPRQPTATG